MADRSSDPTAHDLPTTAELEQVRCETSHCPERATHLVMRIDASRDYWYACEPHAREHTRWSASEASLLPQRGQVPSLELVLSMWPPKHRTSSRRDAWRALGYLSEPPMR